MIQSMLNFEFLEKGLGIVFHHIVHILLKNKKRSATSLPASFFEFVWRKVFLWLYFINGLSFIVWLLLLCEILGKMLQPGCYVMNFEINLTFLIKPKKSRQFIIGTSDFPHIMHFC